MSTSEVTKKTFTQEINKDTLYLSSIEFYYYNKLHSNVVY